MLVIMTTLIFFYSKWPLLHIKSHSHRTIRTCWQAIKLPREGNTHSTAAFLPHAVPAEKDWKSKWRWDPTAKPTCRFYHWRLLGTYFQGLTLDTELCFTCLKSIILTLPSKEKKKKKKRNKTLLGTILSEWYLLGTVQTGSCQGDGDTHHPYANHEFPISALLYSAAILQLQALGKQKKQKGNKALSCHVPAPHTPQQTHRGRGAVWELNKVKKRKILIASPKGASLL